MIAAMLKLPFANACVGLTINSDTAHATSEIDGGHATFQAKLPMIVGGKKAWLRKKTSVFLT